MSKLYLRYLTALGGTPFNDSKCYYSLKILVLCAHEMVRERMCKQVGSLLTNRMALMGKENL